MAPKEQRAVYRGDVPTLVAALRPFAASGPSICRYPDEAEHPGAAKTIHGPCGIEGHVDLLSALRRLQSNLAFTKSSMRSALQTLASENHAKWKLSPTEADDFISTICRRVRNLCRVTMQAMIKSPDAAFVRQLPWHLPGWEAQPPPQPQDAMVGASASTSAGSCVTFNHEMLLPTRVVNGSQEVGLPVDLGACRAAGRTVVSFLDGSQHDITDQLPLCQAEKLLSPGAGKRAATVGDLWAAEHVTTRNLVSIRQKTDRSLLLIGREQERQLVMVKVRAFGELSDKEDAGVLPATHPVLQAAVRFLSPIMAKYANNEIKREDLKAARDEAMKAQGIVGPVRKRLAKADARKQVPVEEPKGHDEQQKADDEPQREGKPTEPQPEGQPKPTGKRRKTKPCDANQEPEGKRSTDDKHEGEGKEKADDQPQPKAKQKADYQPKPQAKRARRKPAAAPSARSSSTSSSSSTCSPSSPSTSTPEGPRPSSSWALDVGPPRSLGEGLSWS